MSLKTERQLANTQGKLALLERQIAAAKARPDTPANRESLLALTQMANQLREEITRFHSQHKRRAS